MHDYTWKVANFEVFNKLKWDCFFFYNILQQCEYWVANKKKMKQNHCYVVASKIAEHIQHACRHDEFNLHALEVVSSSQ